MPYGMNSMEPATPTPKNDIVCTEGSLHMEKCCARFNSFVFDAHHSRN